MVPLLIIMGGDNAGEQVIVLVVVIMMVNMMVMNKVMVMVQYLNQQNITLIQTLGMICIWTSAL